MSEADLPIDALRALAHPLRLRILKILCEGERNVGEIEELGDFAQPGLSQQLAILRQAGLVNSRRQGKLVFYGVERAAFRQIMDCLAEICEPAEAGSGAVRPGPAEAGRSPFPGAAQFARIT